MSVTLAERESVSTRKPVKSNTLDITYELVAFCPSCFAMETLYFTDEGLLPTRKFHQEGNKVYHCPGQSCRLYRSS